jgi:hypothetical protein
VRYDSLEQALAAGYVEGSPCEQLPAVGGMGHHYVNPTLLGDLDVDPIRPEILLYAEVEREARARRRRVLRRRARQHGVRPRALVRGGTASARVLQSAPVLFGQTFDGPMAGHAPDMPWHYDLRVWLWRDNPDGLFAMWNPNVVCP